MKKIIAIILPIIAIGIFLFVAPYYSFVTKTLDISPFSLLIHSSVPAEIDHQVGILMLGIAGGTHDGPNLSDSISVVVYNFKTHSITSLGVPRDIWSETLHDKINSAYAYGEAKQAGGGIKLAKAEISAVVGVPIQYAVVIDFSKFKQLIDQMGGIDVNVPNTFTDKDFPIEGKENDTCNGDPEFRCRYQTVHFEKGLQHMDGETALKFARSRHAAGSEGSDFARGNRQQIIMQAIKEKAIAIGKTGNIHRITELYNAFNTLVQRDIPNQDAAVLAKDVVLHKSQTKHVELSQNLFDTPYSDEYDGKYVLVPKKGFSGLHRYIQCLLTGRTNC